MNPEELKNLQFINQCATLKGRLNHQYDSMYGNRNRKQNTPYSHVKQLQIKLDMAFYHLISCENKTLSISNGSV